MKKIIYEYLRLLQFKISPVSTLKSVHLQFTNTCNLNCKFCSFVNPTERQIMSKELLNKFLKEIMENKKFKIKELNLWSAGEPITHPGFVEMLELIKEYKTKYKNFPKVKMLTNTMLLTKELSKKILDTGAVDYIGFSIDGGNREDYEKLRTGGRFSIVKQNIEDFIELNKGEVETMINCVIPLEKPLTTDWMSEEFKGLLYSVNFYKLNHPNNNAGETIIKEYPSHIKFNKVNKRICLALLQGLVVIQNGDVLFCCDDFNGNYPLGNLNNQSLFEISNCDERKRLVKTLFKGKINQIPLCSVCNRYAMPYKIIKNG